MSQVNNFNGFVGYNIRELDINETALYCSNNVDSLFARNSIFQKQKQVNFTSDFLIRTYTSGCYYYDTLMGKWSSNGMGIYEDTNLEQTHCSSFHLTSFAGGLTLTPSIINFQYAFANSSLNRNPIILIVVIIFLFLYAFFASWARYKDKMDMSKQNLTHLKDTNAYGYFYEIKVFTGNRKESETNSKVN